MKRRAARLLWILGGVLVLGSATAMTQLSAQFVYGENHASRPIGVFVGVYFVGWLGFAVASALAMRVRPGRTAAFGHVAFILAVGLVARALLLPSNLIQETDCYRYVLDGESVVHGVNPYARAPEDVVADSPRRFQASLEREDAQEILDRVSYKEIPTIYPPLAQGAFALGVSIAPWNWMGQRLVFLGLDVATLFILLGLLGRTGKPLVWIVLYAWNPLVLKEVANAAHLDSLAGCCLVLLAVCVVRWADRDQLVWVALAGLALAAAVLTKLYPLILLPACLGLIGWRGRRPWLAMAVFCAVFTVVIVLAYQPFLGIGVGRVTEGLRTYAVRWQRNDGAFRLLTYLLTQARAAVGGYRFSSLVQFLLDPRKVSAGIVLAFVAFSLWGLRKSPNTDQWVATIQGILLCWLLFLPAAYPWYAIGLLAISTLRPRVWVVALSGAFGLYYLIFLYDYRDFPSEWKVATQGVEHGIVWLAVLVTIVVDRMARRRRSTACEVVSDK